MKITCQRLFILAAFVLCSACNQSQQPQPTRHERRIIAMAPNVAEILYALGLSNQVAGVSRFTAYPPEAAAKPSVGGTYDPNWEQIVSLQPDLVIGLDSQEEIAAQLKQLNIDFLGVAHERVDEILQSILTIGESCNAEPAAQTLFQTLNKQITRLSDSYAAPTHKPRVLVCVGHDETLSRMYVAASNTFYDDLIELAGGVNACAAKAVKYPEISPESLRAMQPDMVIDIIPNVGNFSTEAWAPYQAVLMTNNYASIPGPRLVLLLEDLIGTLHE